MYNHILIPVAPGQFGEYAQALSVARRLLGPEGRVSVLAVLEAIPSYAGVYVSQDQLEKRIAEVSTDLETEFKDDDVETHLSEGHPANTILDWAQRNAVDCIVVSSHRPGLSDYFLGSTASRIVRHAQCPVHVLR